MTQFTVALSDNPSDPDRPYWIDCDRDFNTGYEDFTEAEANAVCAILNDTGDMLDWDTITADCRWKLVEARAEVERLRAALAEAEQDAALLSKALKDLANELTKSNAGR
jgi:hypothetical protein